MKSIKFVQENVKEFQINLEVVKPRIAVNMGKNLNQVNVKKEIIKFLN